MIREYIECAYSELAASFIPSVFLPLVVHIFTPLLLHCCSLFSFGNLNCGRQLGKLAYLFLRFVTIVKEEEGGGQEEHPSQNNDKGAEHEGIAQAQELP